MVQYDWRIHQVPAAAAAHARARRYAMGRFPSERSKATGKGHADAVGTAAAAGHGLPCFFG